MSESFTAPGDQVERLMYGFSFLLCLPSGMSEQPLAATGTVMRPGTLRRYASEAVFKDVEILEQVQRDFLRFYRLAPWGAARTTPLPGRDHVDSGLHEE